MENNKNKKSVKFQGDMLNFCDFIQVFVFTRNHHLNVLIVYWEIYIKVNGYTVMFFCHLYKANNFGKFAIFISTSLPSDRLTLKGKNLLP